MATLFPPIDTILRSRQKPTEGELFLLDYLEKEFDPEAEVYFQPYFNGDRPDIVILHREKGLIIIEVKDWGLGHYNLDEHNKWRLKQNNAKLKSPFKQAFDYKQNMFDIHINGLLEKKIRNENFYKVISCFVYFHKATKQSLSDFYQPQIDYYNEEIHTNYNARGNGKLPHDQYEKRDDYLKRRRGVFERDLSRHSLTKEQFGKITFPFKKAHPIFPLEVCQEFLRYLQPPFHAMNEGKVIKYEKKQRALIASEENARTKVKGVAGSGKTSVLAARAVSAHKRHEDRVLILTFNLTLRMYVKNKLNEVRENFPWGVFDIINYHKFFNQSLNSMGLVFDIPEEIKDNDELRNAYIDKNYYSNEKIFEGCDIPNRYQTILVDEIQDYKPEWIKIIRRYFLSENGEMVLFGDEKQNIYEREMEDDKTTRTVQGFGRWQKLTKSFRYADDSHILELASDFQSSYFAGTYESDFEEPVQPSLTGVGLYQWLNYDKNDIRPVVEYIFKTARNENIHPNDITILSSQISNLREIDFLIRKDDDFNEKTLTTFEAKEAYSSVAFIENIKKIRANKKYGFNLNSGVVKLSTIHSFKGYESPTVFLLIDEHDNEELVYVGITRAKFNLVVFVQQNSKYEYFFSQRLNRA